MLALLSSVASHFSVRLAELGHTTFAFQTPLKWSHLLVFFHSLELRKETDTGGWK